MSQPLPRPSADELRTHRERGDSLEDIALRYKTSRRTVKRWFVEYGLDTGALAKPRAWRGGLGRPRKRVYP